MKYKTKNGHVYPIELYYKKIQKNDIVYSPQEIEKLCMLGCKNYGKSGGYPPLAPKFEKFPTLSKNYIIVIVIFDSKYKPIKVKECKNRAIHWKFQDGILARFMDNLGRNLRNNYSGYFLGTGYCMGCPGKKCSIKLGKPCRFPSKRSFSMEATGINVVATVKKCFFKKFSLVY